jgi:hypothetical protein
MKSMPLLAESDMAPERVGVRRPKAAALRCFLGANKFDGHKLDGHKNDVAPCVFGCRFASS